MADRLDGFQRRHRWLGFPIAVIYKFTDDQGVYLGALMTYYGFLSLFPLLLLFTSILGLVLPGHPQLQGQILNSALSQIPVIGPELGGSHRLGGGVTAIVIGSLTALYGSLGVAQALQNAMNQVWAVPRYRRPNPIFARLRSLLIVLTVGLAVVATTVLSGLTRLSDLFGSRATGVLSTLVVIATVSLNVVVTLVAFRISTVRPFQVREALPGAVLAAVGWQLMQTFGAQYVNRVLKSSSATASVSAVVLGLLAFLFLSACGLVLCAEVNVVLARRLYPRALLTVVTDAVNLTPGDKAHYSAATRAQRFKGTELVEVAFVDDGQNGRRDDEQSRVDDG